MFSEGIKCEHILDIQQVRLSGPLTTLEKNRSFQPQIGPQTIFWEVSALLDVRHFPKLQSLQYSVAIAVTEAIRGTSSDKLFQELGLEILKSRYWLRKLCLFYKLIKEQSPAYLFQLIPQNKTPYTTRSVQKSQIPFFKTKTNFLKNFFFPAVRLA